MRAEIIEKVFNPIYKTLAKKHQGQLKEKIKEVIHLTLSRVETKEALGIIEGRAGYKISNPLGKLIQEAKKVIKQFETQQFLPDFSQISFELDCNDFSIFFSFIYFSNPTNYV